MRSVTIICEHTSLNVINVSHANKVIAPHMHWIIHFRHLCHVRSFGGVMLETRALCHSVDEAYRCICQHASRGQRLKKWDWTDESIAHVRAIARS
jgi:hypothetical protein